MEIKELNMPEEKEFMLKLVKDLKSLFHYRYILN